MQNDGLAGRVVFGESRQINRDAFAGQGEVARGKGRVDAFARFIHGFAHRAYDYYVRQAVAETALNGHRQTIRPSLS